MAGDEIPNVWIGDANAEKSDGNFGREESVRTDARLLLSQRFGITAEFLRVPQLSQMMGIAGNSVRCLMREGRFPMPHRKIGKVALVKFDDFVEWYCSSEGALPLSGVSSSAGVARPDGAFEVDCPKVGEAYPHDGLASAETAKERSKRISQEIIVSMRRRGLM